MSDKLCLPPERVNSLLNRVKEYIIKTRLEMDYLEKMLNEIKVELKLQKKERVKL